MITEVSPSSEWAQRWTNGQHTWRHRSDGGFDASRYTVEPIDFETARSWVVAHHYSRAFVADQLRYGLFDETGLVGSMVLSVPAQSKVLTNPLPDLEPYVESMELGRLVLADRVPANGESWFVARAFEEAATQGVRGVVSFADPVPRRRPDGTLLFPGHIGTVYQALNARYCGRSKVETKVLLPDGTVFSYRSMSKVRGSESGRNYVERRLVGLGATPMRGSECPKAWLHAALDELGATRIRHRGQHRYVFALGTKSQRRRVRIAMPQHAYPKEVDAA